MKKKLSIKLNLENPCSENWELMSLTNDGRYCAKCCKEVVDMTTWANNDFVNYFNLNQEKICGRLYESQINKLFVDNTILQRRKLNYEKAIALIMSFFALHNVSAQNQLNQTIGTEIVASPKSDTIKISGIITGENSKPLNNVSIEFNDKNYNTDSNGYFEIILYSAVAKNGLLVFNYEGLGQEARNYNVAMNSTTYNIQMHKSVSGQRIVTGGIGANFYLPCDHDINYVVVSSNILDKKTKKTLDEFSNIMKSNPSFKIELKTFYTTNAKLTLQKALLVKKYLVDIDGIDDERFILAEPRKLENIKDKNKVYFTPPEW
jgi:hypothetical protein